MGRPVQLFLNRDLPPGARTVIQVEGRSIALFNIDGVIYAIDDSCPHNGASLAGGKLDGRTVQCRAHGLRFDLATGCMPQGGLAVRTYPARLNDGTLEIVLPSDNAAGM